MRTLILLFVLLYAPLLHAQSFQGLGDLPGGDFFSSAHGVSGDGSVVVGGSSSGDEAEAFRWTTSGGMVGLGDFPGGEFQSEAYAVSADGAVVVGVGETSSSDEAFRWTAESGMVGLGFLPGGAYSEATGVSADGSVIVGVGSPTGTSGAEAFRWTAGGGMAGLGYLPGGGVSYAFGVSADGAVVVGRASGPSGTEAFRWTAGGGMVGLGDFPGGAFYSQAEGVSADGSVVVGYGTIAGGIEAFRWTAGGGMVGLGDLPGGGFSSIANGVSADGAVVVGRGSGTGSSEAFVWTETDGMRALKDVLEDDLGLDLTGWTLSTATAVSADGSTIVGFGTNPDGQFEAWRAELSIARWLDPVSGFFNEPTRWSINDIPAEEHAVVFDAFTPSFYAVTFVQDQTTRSLTLDSTEVRFYLGGATYTLSQIGSAALQVGVKEDRAGVLVLEGGTLAAEDAVLGRDPSSEGVLALGPNGEAAVLDLDGEATVGLNGTGDLDVFRGTVRIRRGLRVGEYEGSRGTVRIRSGNLLQVTESADGSFIGLAGTGTLEVNGTASFAGLVNVGSAASGNGTLILEGASAATLDLLQIGVAGVGGLDILDGSVLASTEVVLGLQPGSFGTALVHGAGSRWDISTSTQIGVQGAALVQVQDGATICFNSGDHQVGSQGRVEVVGTVVISGTGCPPLRASQGSGRSGGALLATPALSLAEGAELQADAVTLEEGGTLGGDGALSLPIINSGTLDPGGPDTAGHFTLDADYTQAPGGILHLDLGGLAPGTEHDQLSVTGTATLGGTVALGLLASYVPNVGDTFTLVEAAAIAGTFDAVEPVQGLTVELAYTETEVVAEVTGVSVTNEPDALPGSYVLHTAYPNPFAAHAVVPFDVTEAGPVRVVVYDVLGREITVLVDDERAAGRYEAVLNGVGLPSGVYLVRMTAGAFVQTQRVTLLR